MRGCGWAFGTGVPLRRKRSRGIGRSNKRHSGQGIAHGMPQENRNCVSDRFCSNGEPDGAEFPEYKVIIPQQGENVNKNVQYHSIARAVNHIYVIFVMLYHRLPSFDFREKNILLHLPERCSAGKKRRTAGNREFLTVLYMHRELIILFPGTYRGA